MKQLSVLTIAFMDCGLHFPLKYEEFSFNILFAQKVFSAIKQYIF